MWFCGVLQVMYSLGNWDDSHSGKFPKFRNLVKLSFETRTKRGWKVLTSMLKRSPKLETLVLMVRFWFLHIWLYITIFQSSYILHIYIYIYTLVVPIIYPLVGPGPSLYQQARGLRQA